MQGLEAAQGITPRIQGRLGAVGLALAALCGCGADSADARDARLPWDSGRPGGDQGADLPLSLLENGAACQKSAQCASGWCVEQVCCAESFSLINSIIFDNGLAPVSGCTVGFCDVEGGAPGTGNLDLVPEFADVSQGDYSLLFSSPCRDAGMSSTGVTVIDLVGNPRHAGNAVDMGAYETP